ncbi:hypothetical protein HYU16_00540 [Candidatus Woesearchaeota archaeon]|nr:hypothetical protein [Candidatus Woesearchaeota archaeon]
MALPIIDYYDDWAVNGAGLDDGVIWTDDDIAFEVNGIAGASADFVCLDWNNDGTFDNCYYDSNGCGSSCGVNDCDSFSIPQNMNDANKASCDIEANCKEGVDVPQRVCDGCSGVDTSNIQKSDVNATVYYDCDNSESDMHSDSLVKVSFWVVNPQKYDCDASATEEADNNKAGTDNYDLEGKNGSGATDWKNIKSDLSCLNFKQNTVCDPNTAHTPHDDQEVTTRTGSIPVPCTLQDGSTVNHICTQNADCYSGNCGGWATDEKHVCVNDGSNNYYQQFKYTNRTCGGGGYTDSVFYTNAMLSCAVKAGPSYVCDSDHDENVTTNPTTPALPCKKAVGQPCSQDSDCWNDDGGILCTSGYCKGPPTYCTGSIEMLTEDSSGAPLSGLNVYWNATYNGTTDSLGQRILNLNVTCSSDQNVTVKCSDNSTVCDAKTTQIDSNGDVDFLYFECTKCSPKNDLYITQSDVCVNITSKGVNVTVHSSSVTSNVQVTVYRLDEEGVTKESKSTTISLTAGSEKNASFTLSSIASTDFLHIYVDSNDAVKEDDETNNYVFRAAVKPIKAYVDVRLDPSFSILNELIKEYISTFVEPASSSDADVVIIVGHPRVSNSEPFNITSTILGSAKSMQKDYAGVVKSGPDFVNSYSGKPEILAYGNKIQGDVAAVKRLINARNIFLNKGAYSKYFTVYVDDYDTLGISVMDLMTRNETKLHMRNNNITLANDVRKILFDNNFEVAVKPVKTLSSTSYGNSTILRVKNVNSDFSANYRNATGISDKPVVLSRGIHSNLFSWQDFARELTGEGFDAWLIEMVGGPYTDDTSADGCGSNCPNYTFNDLRDFYWPASIAGIQKYSGKNKIDYVGFSLGCSAALESLEAHQTGKNNTGYYFDYDTGQYKFTNLSPYPVDTFVGIGCPGNFTKLASLTWLLKESESSFGIIQDLKDQGKKHVTMANLVVELGKNVDKLTASPPSYFPFTKPKELLLYLAGQGADSLGPKMSIHVYEEFLSWINDPNKPKLGHNVVLNNTLLIQGKLDTILIPLQYPFYLKAPHPLGQNTDGIVANADIAEACSNINSSNKWYASFDNRYHTFIPPVLPDDRVVKNLIKSFLKSQTVSENGLFGTNGKNNCNMI